MNFGNKLKMLLAETALPILVGFGKDEAYELLLKMSEKQPKKFAVLLQSTYPTFKGVLQPFCKSTKTKLDDKLVDPAVELLEDVMNEKGIPIPVVTPVDFDSDEDLPDEEIPPGAEEA